MDCNRRIQCGPQSRLTSDGRGPALRKRLTGDSLGGLEWLCQMDRSDKVAEGQGPGLWYDAAAWEMFEVFRRVPQLQTQNAGPADEDRRKPLTSEPSRLRTTLPALIGTDERTRPAEASYLMFARGVADSCRPLCPVQSECLARQSLRASRTSRTTDRVRNPVPSADPNPAGTPFARTDYQRRVTHSAS